MKKGLSIFILVLVIMFALGTAFWVFGEDIQQIAHDKFNLELNIDSLTQRFSEIKDDNEDDSTVKNVVVSTETETLAEPEEAKETSIVFTGDVLLANQTSNRYQTSGVEGLLEKDVLEVLKNADVAVINNEFPFSYRGNKAANKEYTFRADPKNVSLLLDMGIDIAGLANNHVLDYGDEALLDTFETLENAGINYTGAGRTIDEAKKLITYEIGGKTYGFLAASRVIPFGSWNIEAHSPGVLACYDSTIICNSIKAAKESCDYVFVCVHWGTEHTTKIEDHQKSLAKAFVDAGADAVIGDHTHCLQGIEYYDGKPVFYSLGNFIFQDTAELAGMVQMKTMPDGRVAYYLLPTKTSNITTSFRTDKREVFDYVESISFDVSIADDGEISNLK